MSRFVLASAASLAMVCGASSIMAQEPAPTPATATTAMTAEQKVSYDGWVADQRISYDSWPADQQNYYWSLTANQQTGWWALTDEQRQKLLAMDAPTRSAAWASIEKQLAAVTAPTPGPANTATSQGSTTYKGALNDPPADAMNKSYPPCSKTVQDNCRNRGGA